MRRTLLLGLLLSVAACSTAPDAPPDAPVIPPPTPTVPTPQPVADSCGAAGLQHLVGKPRSEVPVPVRPERQRVVCTTCAVTMDFNPERLNFLFDATTGLIQQVRCG